MSLRANLPQPGCRTNQEWTPTVARSQDRSARGETPARPAGAPPGGRGTPLIRAKLTPPILPSGILERVRLSERLDAGLHDAVRLSLVSAPAGYGKSTAIAGWLASRDVPWAWLSLEAADSDPFRFVRYLVAALRRVRPEAGDATLNLMAMGAPARPDILAETIIDELATTDDPFVLVLDDYQAVDAEAIHDLVGFLIEHGPPFVHIVLATREEPPIRLARLRAHGRLVEIHGRDLRFTDAEAAEVLAGLADSGVPATTIGRLVERTEGWAVALQLAVLSLRARPDADALAWAISAISASRGTLFDYLAQEVTSGLDPDLRTFLVAVSVAGTLTPDLCQALTGRADSAALLEQAEQANLFVSLCDEANAAYRLHPLFAEHLRSLLAEADRRELHERAAAHLEAVGSFYEAIHHALEAGSYERAVRLLELVARPMFDAGELSNLSAWLDELPADRVAASPELGSLGAWALLLSGRLAEAIERAGRIASSAADDEPAAGRLLALRALLATALGPGAEELAEAALERLADDHLFRALALQSSGMAHWTDGDFAGAVERWRSAFEAARRSGQPMAIILALTALAGGLHATGRRPEAEALCREVLADHSDDRGRPRPIAWLARMTLGLLRYEAGDLAGARHELESGFETAGSYGFGGAAVAWAVGYLALARQATGAPEAALEALRTVARGARASGMELPLQSRELEARLRLEQGDVAAAARWADGATPEGPADSPHGRLLQLSQDITVARVRLAQHRPEEAARLLGRAREVAAAAGGVADLISIRVLEARTAEQAGRRAAALRDLEDAVRLAAPGHYVRRLVDDGAGLAQLLPHVRKAAPAFVDEVARALAPSSPREAGADGAAPADRRALLESLTPRELDVLRLMAFGASDAEIAGDLVVSLATARWHTANVRSKLGVRSRTQAVLRAQELALV
jgi:LuxR family transcriptional regulator, maltose regulon positive regulatory protein